MKSLNFFSVLICSLLVSITMHSQDKLNIVVKGKVVAAGNQVPLEFATISIFRNSDGSLLKGDVTDPSGAFSISLDQSEINVEIAYIGLSTKKITDIQVDEMSGIADLGDVVLDQSAIQLQDVVVIGEKSQLKFDLDKKVFNVGKDVAAGATNALDVLDQVPSVNVDPNGKISIRGSGGITILIDGKPSVLANAQQLQNLLPERLDKVEVITNPSAKYDAAGIAGILNIVMKKEEDPGISGATTLRASNPHDYSIGIGLSRRKSKMNVFGDVSLRHWSRPRTSYRENENLVNSGTIERSQFTNQNRRSLSIEADGGFDYYFNDKNVLTTSVIYEAGRQPHDATIDYLNFGSTGQLLSSELRINEELEFESSLEYLLNFEKTYAVDQKKLRAFMKYTNNTESNASSIFQNSFDENSMIIEGSDIEQRTSVDEKDQTMIVQFDFEQPLSEYGKIEVGGKGSFRQIGNQFSIEQNTNGE